MRNLRPLDQHARSMRRTMTPSEEAIWNMVRRRALGDRFRRQHPMGDLVVDFVCLDRTLVVEADGLHHERDPGDEMRDAELRRRGFRVLRFWNDEVAFEPEWVESVIRTWLANPILGLDGESHPE